jgi:nitric oxide synthase oxygenase domain/subunit
MCVCVYTYTYKTIILPVVLYGHETWSDIKRGTQTEGVWEQGSEENVWADEMKWRESEENCIMRNFVIYTLCQV